jgi:Xaa-Pro dipeptidase
MSLPSDPRLTRRSALALAGLSAASCAASGVRTTESMSDPLTRARAQIEGLKDPFVMPAAITPTERAARRARLAAGMREARVDAYLLESGATLEWLTGVRWGRSERLFALCVLADGSHFWVVPAFEVGKARLSIDQQTGPGGEILAWEEHEYFEAPLAEALRRRGVDRVAIEPSLRHGFVARLGAQIGTQRLLDGRALVIQLRASKSPAELAILRSASERTQWAIQRVSEQLAPGMDGAAIAQLMALAHTRVGMTNAWCLGLLGPAAALPHGDSDERRIEIGTVILVDTGATLLSYQSDTTRTWAFDGACGLEFERAWNAVRDAQRAAFDALRPGREAREIDAIARARLVERGYAAGYEHFTHRLGHGIGVEGHEDPYFDGGSHVVLAEGMTLSNEPGLYFPGRFGVRIEDIVAITSSGADHFGGWQADPQSPASAAS